jgi:hypothetical protein
MIYCIGLTVRYEAALAAPAAPVKRGGDADYAGGWVWASPADAERFIAMNGLTATHSVYGVLADWQTDTVAVAGKPYHRLMRDAVVVRRPVSGEE